MRDKKITTFGVKVRFSGVGRQSFADSSSWFVLAIIFAISNLLAAGDVRADNKYYNGGVQSTVFGADFDTVTIGTQTCANSGCHDKALGTCSGSTTSNWGDYTCAYTFRSDISGRISGDITPRMPDGGPFGQNANFSARLTTWADNGYG